MEELVAIILLGFGTILGCLILWKIYHVIKSSIDKDSASIKEENFDRLARAFIQHKKDMNERVENLEAIIADNDGVEKDQYPQIEEHREDGRLKNDLKQKDRVS
ncbi:hypothetical protein NC796_20125 [Aliifodinibius sp. S!AR15-10]|uniref:hypothetical protein n=1 Tax=Aliifodinibius sp. S!AR15-10 TaxID=2950437 RepID=UPI002863F25D|nr:hypothetical protein [Aliifodinibius sp. S!AR15-10]MDR8393473.1 hypothetical protein [Aliifodinibius sp. S!AR15-10]